MINKYEAIGIFFSIAIMALALSFWQFGGLFKDDVVVNIQSDEQGAIVVSSTGGHGDNAELADALTDGATAQGILQQLIIDDVVIGEGEEARKGDLLTVNYIGTTRDGNEFDNSYTRGEPFTFKVGEGRVIEGWDKGIVGMKVGGQRILVIPADLAYGNAQVGPIPAGSILVFAIELLSIN